MQRRGRYRGQLHLFGSQRIVGLFETERQIHLIQAGICMIHLILFNLRHLYGLAQVAYLVVIPPNSPRSHIEAQNLGCDQ